MTVSDAVGCTVDNVGQRGVDEGLADVDTATGGLQHPLDQIAHLRLAEPQVEMLGNPAAGDVHLRAGVHPDLLDTRIVEERLQRAVSVHGREHVAHRSLLVVDEGATASEGQVVVAAHLGLGDPPRRVGIERGVGPFAAQAPAHAVGHGEGGGIHAEHPRKNRDRPSEVIHSEVGLTSNRASAYSGVVSPDRYPDALHAALAPHDHEVRRRLALVDTVSREHGGLPVIIDVFIDDDAEGPFDVWARLDGMTAFELEPVLGDQRHLFGVTWEERGWDPDVPPRPEGWSRGDLEETVLDVVARWLTPLLPSVRGAFDWTVESPEGAADAHVLPVDDRS